MHTYLCNCDEARGLPEMGLHTRMMKNIGEVHRFAGGTMAGLARMMALVEDGSAIQRARSATAATFGDALRTQRKACGGDCVEASVSPESSTGPSRHLSSCALGARLSGP